MYDRSEAAVRRIVAKGRDGGEVGHAYISLAMLLMRSATPSPLRDRALKRLADSCDDAMPMLEKKAQSPGRSPTDASSRRQTDR